METHLPTPKNGRVELLIYWRVSMKYMIQLLGYLHDLGNNQIVYDTYNIL
jgi:hypothetical protein